MSKVDERLSAAGLQIPPCAPAGALFAPAIQTGNLVFLSGAIGTAWNGKAWTLPYRGAIGRELTIEEGKASAKLCVLNHLAALRDLLSDLDRVRRVVRLAGHIHAAEGFTKGPFVLDGASETLLAAFGDPIGRHTRLALYQHTMSFNAPLETDLIVEVA